MNTDNIVVGQCAVMSAVDTIQTYSNRNTTGSSTIIRTYRVVGEVYIQTAQTTGNFPTTAPFCLSTPLDFKGYTNTQFFAELASLVFIATALILLFKFVVRPFWRTR